MILQERQCSRYRKILEHGVGKRRPAGVVTNTAVHMQALVNNDIYAGKIYSAVLALTEPARSCRHVRGSPWVQAGSSSG